MEILEFMAEQEKWAVSEIFITTKGLHNRYLRFCKDRGFRYPKDSAHMARVLFSEDGGVCPAAKRFRPRQEGGDRSPGYKVPKLSKCRADFETSLGEERIELEW